MRPALLATVATIGALALSPAADALPTEFQGAKLTVVLFAGDVRYEVPATGVASGIADVSRSPLGTITRLLVPAGVVATTRLLRPVTDPAAFPVQGIVATVSNASGSFAPSPSGFGGTMSLRGVNKVCLFTPCLVPAPANIVVPMSVIGAGGNATVSMLVNLTVAGAPWTTGPITYGMRPPTGPLKATGGFASTPGGGTSLNLVTPIFISTNIGASAVIPSYARFQLALRGGECGSGPDADEDGWVDACDSCSTVSNADQRDTNLDGYGNRCDPDTDDDGRIGLSDFNALRAVFGDNCPLPYSACGHADGDGDGTVGIADFNLLRVFFGRGPGPSGLACAGAFPCPEDACPHDVCTEGAGLRVGCDGAEGVAEPGPCAAQVCAADPQCCGHAWGPECVEQANVLCGVSCSYPCAHDACTEGDPLRRLCEGDEPGYDVGLCALTVCEQDATCCTDAWGPQCVELAKGLCDAPCAYDCAHDACTEGAPLRPLCDGEAPGYDVGQCAASVCAAMPACCADAWGPDCVEEARRLCDVPCTYPCAHGNCEEGEPLRPLCEGLEEGEDVGICAEAVCAVDPDCCTTGWDAACVASAKTICGRACPPPCAHDVCVAGGPLDAACSACATAVCEDDLYCCTVAWDARCVSDADQACPEVDCSG